MNAGRTCNGNFSSPSHHPVSRHSPAARTAKAGGGGQAVSESEKAKQGEQRNERTGKAPDWRRLHHLHHYLGERQHTGKEVEDGGLVIEKTTGETEIVNLDFVTRIREYPRKKNGKKKSIVVD